MSKELIDNAKDLREIGEGIREPICFAAADELESLRAQLKEAQADAAHWKNNHETEVRRARILKERTDMPIERVDAYEQWGKDQMALKEAQAEIEHLKRSREHFAVYAESTLCQLAAGQAREVQLREALANLDNYISNNLSSDYPTGVDVCGKEFCESEKALSLPSDTTALDAMIQKAGEVMRERCAYSMEDYLDDPILSGHGYANGAGEEIRALPGVTLEDLK